jgi:hypothetical protein
MDRRSSPSQTSQVPSPGPTASQKSNCSSSEEAVEAQVLTRCPLLFDFQDLQQTSAQGHDPFQNPFHDPFHSGNGDLRHDFLLLSRQHDESKKLILQEALRTVYGIEALQIDAKTP